MEKETYIRLYHPEVTDFCCCEECIKGKAVQIWETVKVFGYEYKCFTKAGFEHLQKITDAEEEKANSEGSIEDSGRGKRKGTDWSDAAQRKREIALRRKRNRGVNK